MTEIKGTGELSDLLVEFESKAKDSIEAELQRIGRIVNMAELPYIPFSPEVLPFVEAIRLDANGEPVLDTSFADTSEKRLSSFMSDSEIGHWDLIALIGMLQDIQP